MLNILKNKVEKFIYNKIYLYNNQKFSSSNKWSVIIHCTSWFELPLQIEGGSNIFIGRDSSIGKHIWLAAYTKYLFNDNYRPKIEIGNGVRIGNYACIVAIKNIKIGDGVLISEYFYVSDHSHGFDVNSNIPPAHQALETKGDGVTIGENTFIGYRVTILPGVTLGKNCVVGSHSVVNKSFPDYSMIGGVPAKILKQYDFVSKTWVKVN